MANYSLKISLLLTVMNKNISFTGCMLLFRNFEKLLFDMESICNGIDSDDTGPKFIWCQVLQYHTPLYVD